MKKLTAIILAILITITFSTSAFCGTDYSYTLSGKSLLSNADAVYSTVYSADGRTITVQNHQVPIYTDGGWFTEPVMTVYDKNADSVLIYEKHKDAYLSSGWYLSPDDIPKNTKAVALTYDDGPSKYTNQILDCLSAYGAKATFFVVGTNVNRYPEIVARADSLGMEIGNHTMTHPKLTSISQSAVASELNSNANAVEAAIGKRPTIIRPPYGSYNQSVLITANQPFILWSIDTLDWKTRNAQKTINAVLSEVSDGDIILMHDLYSATAEATEVIVPALIEMGFDLVTVSELAQRKGTGMTVKSYRSFK